MDFAAIIEYLVLFATAGVHCVAASPQTSPYTFKRLFDADSESETHRNPHLNHVVQ